MEKIYIVQIEGGDYECNWTDPIKAFYKKDDAETFKTELELKQLEFEEKRNTLLKKYETLSLQDRLKSDFGSQLADLMKEYRETPFSSSTYGGIYIEEMEIV